MWVVEAVVVAVVIWAMMAVPQLLSYRLSNRCEKFFVVASFVFSIMFAILVNGLKFYGIIPIGEK